LGFGPCNCFLNIRESTEIPTPNVGVPLGVWRSIPSHSLALLGACGLTFRLPSWLATLQALALVASPRLRLQQKSIKEYLLLLLVGRNIWTISSSNTSFPVFNLWGLISSCGNLCTYLNSLKKQASRGRFFNDWLIMLSISSINFCP